VIDRRGGDQLGTHWFEVSILQFSSQMESRMNSSTATLSSLSSNSPQGNSLPYYIQDNTLDKEHFTGKELWADTFRSVAFIIIILVQLCWNDKICP